MFTSMQSMQVAHEIQADHRRRASIVEVHPAGPPGEPHRARPPRPTDPVRCRRAPADRRPAPRPVERPGPQRGLSQPSPPSPRSRVGAVASLNRVLAGRAGLSPVMVGRSGALAQLQALIPTTGVTVADLPTVALVAGEAGVGKTRLLRELVSGLPSTVALLTGGADPDSLSRPYSLARAVLPDAPADATPDPADDATADHPEAHPDAVVARFAARIGQRAGGGDLRGPPLGRRRERNRDRPPGAASVPPPPR